MFSKGFAQSLRLPFRQGKSEPEDSPSPEPEHTSPLASNGAPTPVSNHLSFIGQGDGRKASSKRFQSYRLVGRQVSIPHELLVKGGLVRKPLS
jgi:hypothetical protein